MYPKNLLFLLVCFISCSTHAQEATSLVRALPPLETVLSWAERSAYRVKEQEMMSLEKQESISIAQKKWMDKVFVDLGAQRSNNGSVLNVTNSLTEGDINSLSFQNLNSLRTGLTVRLSLFDGLGRKHLVQEAAYRKKASDYRILYLKQEAQQTITTLYKDVALMGKIILIKAEKQTMLQLQKQLAEKEFKQGQIHLSELARVSELAANARIDFEIALNEYDKAFSALELLVGVSFDSLNQGKKP